MVSAYIFAGNLMSLFCDFMDYQIVRFDEKKRDRRKLRISACLVFFIVKMCLLKYCLEIELEPELELTTVESKRVRSDPIDEIRQWSSQAAVGIRCHHAAHLVDALAIPEVDKLGKYLDVEPLGEIDEP